MVSAHKHALQDLVWSELSKSFNQPNKQTTDKQSLADEAQLGLWSLEQVGMTSIATLCLMIYHLASFNIENPHKDIY